MIVYIKLKKGVKISKIYNTFVHCVCIALVSGAFAWGQTGHRVVAYLAQRHLNPIAKEKAHKILDGYSLQDVSNWADEIRSDHQSLYKSFARWHYMEVSDSKDIAAISRVENWPENIHQAIEYCISELKKQPEEARLQRAILLKMLVHS